MDRFRLKNCIILILVLMDLFLLFSLISREGNLHSAQRTAVQQMTQLFAADGIALDPDIISDQTPPTGLAVTHSSDWERQAAAMLLGKELSYSDQGGGISSYSSNRGAAMFRSTGVFDAAGTLAADGIGFCREFCETFGYEEPVFQLSESNSGSATVCRIYEEYPVFNCSITFSLTNGILTGVSGTLLPDTFSAVTGETAPLSAAAALTAFQKLRRETQAVVSVISDIYLCYELQSSASAPMALNPSWCIVTDMEKYYVNCITGAVALP